MHEAEKIAEARFFLNRMTTEADQPAAFRYQLSAFLSAARSALQYALEEVKADPLGKAWYDAQMGTSVVLKFFKDKRDVNIHRWPVVPATAVHVELIDSIHLSDSLSITIRDQDGNVVREVTPPPEPPPPQEHPDLPPVISYRHTFADWAGPEDILTLSSTYLRAVEVVIQDGIAQGYLSKPA